jgi:asparagine synthetase B (glutamine-hydrolysing)
VNPLVRLLKDAILDRLDGNCGIVLSGGLDSSTVAALTYDVPSYIPSFTGYYIEPGYDEREYARLVASPGGHHEILITPHDFVEHFEAMRSHTRPPIMGMGTFGQYMVARYASQFVDVVLSGEGSDELFGGYARQMIVAGEKPPMGYEDYQLPAGYPTDLKAALDYDYALLPDLLAVDDQMTGAFGLEARAPFTDQRIVDYALALPVTERVGKRHLREAVRGIVPDAIIDRKDKRGFPIPLVLWAQTEPVRTFVMDRLGYLPDPAKPFDRGWWVELVEGQRIAA